MKNNLLLNTLRCVKKAPGRFIAIIAIITISCAFYSGVKAACPQMKQTAWKYYDDYSLADIQIKSTIGFNDDDVDKLLETKKYDKGYAGYSADLFISDDHGQVPVKVLSYSSDYPLNKVRLTEGRLPEKPGECLADANAGSKISFEIGQTIRFHTEENENIEDYLNNDEYTVVGLVTSPLYVSFERGATNIGNGSLSAFVYVPYENFSYEAYTDIYLSVPEAHDSSVQPFSDRYEEIISTAESFAEMLSKGYLAERADKIRADADEELSEAREKLADGEKKYNDGKADYDKGLKEYNDANARLDDSLSEFKSAEDEINEGFAQLDETDIKLEHLKYTCERVDSFLKEYDGVYMKVLPSDLLDVFKEIQQIYDENDIDAQIEELMAVYIITNPEKDPVSKETARLAIIGVNEQIRTASAEAESQAKLQREALEKTQEELEENRSQLTEAENEIKKAKHELDDAKKTLDEAQAEIDDAKQEIADAQQELDDLLADSEWYIWNRDEFNPGCMSYGADAERIDSIAAVFPVFFIVIAALVCCTTMSRMVEEQRTEAGTLKALGYSSSSIILQYVMYALTASIIGSVIGVLIGFPLLPNIIYKCYETMYRYPYFEAEYIPSLAAGCIIVSLLCTSISAAFTAIRELQYSPAQLIRPKPPKDGKRIFLEKISFIWNRMKFTSKVSFRNLFRYKSRFLMTVIGIGGCTALLLTAFGLKEAIACIADKQYDEIFTYNAMAVVSDKAESEEIAEIYDTIGNESIFTDNMSAVQDSKDVSSENNKAVESYIFAPDETDSLSNFISLRNRKSGNAIYLEEGSAVITEKLSRLLGVGVGDEITIESGSRPVKVSAITENYTFHYVYMTRTTYNEVLGDKNSNIILMKTSELPEKSVRDEINSKLIDCDGVISASFSYDGTDNFRKLVSSLDLIVIVLILFAAALSFVILFNLANININERTRELATIKVLGFFDGEVGAYIYRENTVSALIGIASGLVLGIFFERFVVKTAEVNEVMFSPDIPWFCFVLAAVFMAVFTIIVNVFLYFKLKKIDMASSMKAIE